MNMCVTHDSHKHFEIYELRPHISRCIIMLCWNILWKSSYVLGGTECSSKTHYNLLRLFDCCIKISFGFLCVIEESKHICFSGYHRPESICRILLHANFSTALWLSIFSASSLRQKSSFVSLPFVHRIFRAFIRAISPSLSLSDFTFTFIIFFLVPFVFKKTFSGPFFFLEILTFASIIHSDSRYRFANERRAFFHIYLLPRSLLHILIIIHTRKTCLFLLFFLLFSTFFSASLRHSSMSNLCYFLFCFFLEKRTGIINVQNKIWYKQLRS